jgi:hypothetical protein
VDNFWDKYLVASLWRTGSSCHPSPTNN